MGVYRMMEALTGHHIGPAPGLLIQAYSERFFRLDYATVYTLKSSFEARTPTIPTRKSMVGPTKTLKTEEPTRTTRPYWNAPTSRTRYDPDP